MPQDKTHRLVKNPQISSRALADYMAASQKAGRSIARGCKYQSRARVIQHDEAKLAVSRCIRGVDDIVAAQEAADALRNKLADSDFERDLYDHNADYIERFIGVADDIELPEAEILVPGKLPSIELGGVKVTVEGFFRFRRLTKTNKIRIGLGTLRYAKGRALPVPVGEWQSAFLYGYLRETNTEEEAEPEKKLCITIDAYSGMVYPAPSDSVRKFQEMEAACLTIAERWPNIAPPPNAVF